MKPINDADCYQALAMRTLSDGGKHYPGILLHDSAAKMYAGNLVKLMLSQSNQVGEQANVIKRALFYGKLAENSTVQDLCVSSNLEVTQTELDAIQDPQFRDMYHAFLGIQSELAEVAEGMMWMIRNGGKIGGKSDKYNQAYFLGEAGDLAWYVCGLFVTAIGLKLSHVFGANIAKLALRYGSKYSDVAAADRDLAAEDAILEQSLWQKVTGWFRK